jgi:hypothetical protein
MRAKILPILALLTVAAFTLTPMVAAHPVGAIPSFTPASVAQSCNAHGVMQMSISCTLPSLQAGEMIFLEVAEVPPSGVADSMGNHFTLLREVPFPGSTYDLQIFFANASQSGNDLVSISGNGNYPELLAHGISGATGVEDSSDGSGNSSTAQVTGYGPFRGTLVIAAALIQNTADVIATSVSAGPGYTLLTAGGALADEETLGTFNTTTSQFTLGAPVNWAEVSVSLFPSAPSGLPMPQFNAPTVLVAAIGLVLVASMKRSKLLKF